MDHKYIVTAGELCTLAALLGYKTVAGVPESRILEMLYDLRGTVSGSVAALEKRGVLRLTLSGSPEIDPDLKMCVDAVCAPEKIGVLYSDQKNAKRHIFRKNGALISLCFQNGDLLLELLCNCSFSDLFPPWQDNPFSSFDAVLPFDRVKEVCSLIGSFRKARAMEILRESVDDARTADMIASVFERKNSLFNVAVFCCEKHIIRCTAFTSLLLCGGETLSLTLRQDNALCFQSAESLCRIYDDLNTEFYK